MINYFSSDFKLGILGGGQLGKMLLLESQRFDIKTFILDPNNDSPCKYSCNKFFIGDLNNFDDVYNFGKLVNVITIEIEHVNIDALNKLESEGKKIFPSPKSLEIIKNKSKQKDFYQENNIPTSKYFKFNNILELKKSLELKNIKYPFVWKSCEMGYDGKGVQIIKSNDDLKKISLNETIILVEECVEIEKELSIIVAKNENGEIKTYPLVEMEFDKEANIVDFVLSPSTVNDYIKQKTKNIAIEIVSKLNIIGILAIEFFLDRQGNVLVNEIAPRVHNSGHYTINGSYTSQFEQHLRAILNLPLGNTDNKFFTVMINLIGDNNFYGNVFYENITQALEIKGVYPFIYGKKETKPFRKMGHINVISDKSIKEALDTAKEIKRNIKVKSF